MLYFPRAVGNWRARKLGVGLCIRLGKMEGQLMRRVEARRYARLADVNIVLLPIRGGSRRGGRSDVHSQQVAVMLGAVGIAIIIRRISGTVDPAMRTLGLFTGSTCAGYPWNVQ